MFHRDWGNMTYREQVGYLSQLVHVVASEMEKSYGAGNEDEIVGAAVSVLEEIPNRTISNFYKNSPYILKEHMKMAVDHLKTCGQISKVHDVEIVCVDPQMPDMEAFVKDIFQAYVQRSKRIYSSMYAGVMQRGYDVIPDPTGLDFSHTRFHR